MKYFDIIKPWLEPQYKLIAQPPPPVSDSDPGDTAQREGMFALAAYVLYRMGSMSYSEYTYCAARYHKMINLLEDPNHPGLIRRYADPKYWGGQSHQLSRDQSISNVVAMGLLHPLALRRFFWAHLKYGGLLFTTNTRRNWATKENHGQKSNPKAAPLTRWQQIVLKYHIPMVNVPGYRNYNWKLPDITVGTFHGLYIRAFKAKWLYPLLLVLDIQMALDALVKVRMYAKNPKSNDDLSFLMQLYQADLTMPTPWSRLSKWIYRSRKYPNNAGDATNPAQACMNAYFRGTNPGPKLEQVYREVNEFFT